MFLKLRRFLHQHFFLELDQNCIKNVIRFLVSIYFSQFVNQIYRISCILLNLLNFPSLHL